MKWSDEVDEAQFSRDTSEDHHDSLSVTQVSPQAYSDDLPDLIPLFGCCCFLQ